MYSCERGAASCLFIRNQKYQMGDENQIEIKAKGNMFYFITWEAGDLRLQQDSYGHEPGIVMLLWHQFYFACLLRLFMMKSELFFVPYKYLAVRKLAHWER